MISPPPENINNYWTSWAWSYDGLKPYEAGYRETNARGGSTSLVAQFLQEMRDPGSEQRNPREIPWSLEEKNTGVEKSIWTWLWSPKPKKSGSGKSDQNRFFQIPAQFSTLLTWNMSIRQISFEAADLRFLKLSKFLKSLHWCKNCACFCEHSGFRGRYHPLA